ncbi:hypothetical protein MASR2M15_03650 [Anaerolineales bacterium]
MPDQIKILLVEDNPGDARLIREMLLQSVKEKILIDPVTTLTAAYEHLSERSYDVILLDLSLPDSYGIETLLKIEMQSAEAAIVVLTGLDDETLGVEAVQMGAQDYLVKGDVESRLLVRSVRYAIERNRTEIALRQSEKEYRSLIDDVFDTSMVAVLILDKDLHVVWCNEATEIYFGIQREHLLGRDKRQLIDEELKCAFADPDSYASQLLRAYEEAVFTEHFECEVVPDGDRQGRWLEHWSQPIRDGIYKGGRIEQYTDITERKLLEFAEREQRGFAEALHEISTLLTSSLNLDDVLDHILANLGRIVPHDSALITIVEDTQLNNVKQKRTDPLAKLGTSEADFELDYKAYIDRMYTTGRTVIVEDVQSDSEIGLSDIKVHSYIGVPIQLQDMVIGFMHLLSEEKGLFTELHSERLAAFSKLAAIAIQNARLFDQSHQLATLEERQRLARELHDSVSQTLFICQTMSESALRRWQKSPKRAYELVKDVNQLTRTALAEMRILLLELRPSALTQISLKQLFEQYLQPIQDRRQFELILMVEDIPPLPPDVQIALYRICQEALNNIDKHAQASQVRIQVNGNADSVDLQIDDNGHGFEPETVRTTSLGLGIMRERAEKIGASISIMSQPHQGTKINVMWKTKEVQL